MRHSVTIEAKDFAVKDAPYDTWRTDINGDHASVALYFFTNAFNIGRDADKMVEVWRLVFKDGPVIIRCPNPACYELHIDGRRIRGSLNMVCTKLNKLD